MTTCFICTKGYTDPIALPCLHTFCMKCLQETALKSNKEPGDELPCPICGGMWKIPPDGFSKSFFIEKVVEVEKTLLDQSASSIPTCDACVAENADAANKISAAEKYCVDCNQQLCQECCRQHRKFQTTKNHYLLPINEHASGQNVMNYQVPDVCELHENHILPVDIYCTDCKTFVCSICFIDDHKNHDGSHVDKFVDGFRKQIESKVEVINECRFKAETKKAELLTVKENIQKKVENFERDVENRKDELKQLADEHATSLLQGLYSISQSKLKEIEVITSDIDTYLSSLETYNSYCQKKIPKGSVSDICRAYSDLSCKALDWQQQCHLMIEREIESFNLCLRKSELEEFLQENCDNLIGEVEEEDDSNSKKISRQCLLSQQSNEIDRLREELKGEITNRESLRSAIVQLRIQTTKEVQAKEEFFTEELSKEKQKVGNIQLTISALQAQKKILMQEMDAKIMTISSLQCSNARLKDELDNERLANKSLQVKNDKLKQELEEVYMTDNFVQTSRRFAQEVNTRTSIREALEDLKKLEQEQGTAETVALPHRSDPVLIQTITTKAAEEKMKMISGLTILDKELFVVSEDFSEVEVYDLMRLTFRHRWNLKGLISPFDISSCSRNKCLYIFNDKGMSQEKEILRVDPNGNLLKNWSTGKDWGCGLSVAYDSNVILTFHAISCLKEYSPDGQLIREINLLMDAGIRHLWHAIKLANGHFMVSLGMFPDDLHRVCLVDAEGNLVKLIGGECGMNRPSYLAVDGDGFVVVADRGNSRVLLFNSNLQFEREIVPKEKHGLQRPWRILLDESNGRLLVADNEVHTNGILIFDFK